MLQRDFDPAYHPFPGRQSFLESNEATADFISAFYEPERDTGTQDSWRQELIEEGKKAAAVPTRALEDPLNQYILNQFVPPLLAMLEKLRLKLNRKIALGTLRTEIINAVALRVPGSTGAFVIGLNTGTVRFMTSAAAIFSKCIPILEEKPPSVGALTDHVANFASDCLAWLPRELSAAFSAYLSGQTPPRIAVPVARLGICTSFSRAMLSFVLAHELAHVALGHLESGTDTSYAIRNNTAHVVKPTWHEEYEADRLGAEITLQAMKELGPLFTWAHPPGVPLALYSLELLERARSIKGGYIPAPTDSHPLSHDRLYRLYETVSSTTAFRDAAFFSEMVGAVIELAWPETQERLLGAG
jgi:hypothetical protein